MAEVVRTERPAASPTSRTLTWLGRHKTDTIIVGVLAALTLATLIVFRREPVFSDDIGYWERWESIGRQRGMANLYRFTIVISAQLARLVFGESMAAYHAVGIAYSIGLVVGLYVLVRLFFPPIVAAGAGVLLVSGRVFLEEATLLMPDWPAMFFFVVGLIILVQAARHWEGHRAILAALAAGLAFFLMALTKESAVPLLFVVPVMLMLVTRIRKALGLTAVTGVFTAAFAVLELFALWIAYGSPWLRLEQIFGGHIRNRTPEALGGRVTDSHVPRSARTADGTSLTWGDLLDRYLDPIGADLSGRILLWMLAISVAITLIARSKRLAFFLIPAVFGLVFVVFAVGSVDPLVPLLSMKFRYLALGWVFVPPLIAGALWTALKPVGSWLRKRGVRGTRIWMSAIVALMLAVPVVAGIIDTYRIPTFLINGSDGLRQVSRAIDGIQAQGAPVNRLVTDGRTLQGLRIQLSSDDQPLLDQATSNYAAARAGDIVVVNRSRFGRGAFPGRGSDLREFVLIPPAGWEQISRSIANEMFVYYVHEDTEHLPSLSVSGESLGHLARGSQFGADERDFGWQAGSEGVLLWMQNVSNARAVLGTGSHPTAPTEPDREHLTIEQHGRLGARVELHLDRSVEVISAWLRTYGHDDQLHQDVRMYSVYEDERVSEPVFTIDTSRMRTVSFAGSTQVDPGLDHTYRVVVFVRGTGAATVDRIATINVSTSANTTE